MNHFKFKIRHWLPAFSLSFLSVGSALAAPMVSSATLQNPTAQAVELEVVGQDLGSVASLENIVFNGVSPLDAEIRNNSTLILTLPVEAGTGKTGAGLTLIPGALKSPDGESNQLIFIGDQHITDQAHPVFLTRRTLDRDSDGKMDGVEFRASEVLNDGLEGFEVQVTGYDVTKITTGDSPNDEWLLVEVAEMEGACNDEELACDTAATPDTVILKNENLKDRATHPNTVPFELSATTSRDGIPPRLLLATFSQKPLNGIVYNTLQLTYSEAVVGTSREDTSEDFFEGEIVLSSPLLGALTQAGALAGLATFTGGFDVTTSHAIGNELHLDSSGAELTVYFNTDPDTHFKKGSLPEGVRVMPIADASVLSDGSGNPVNSTLSVTAQIIEPWDLTPPEVLDVYSCDADGDGNIDRLQVDFSEAILDASVTAANWLADNNTFNEGNGEVTPARLNTATAGCDGQPDDPDPDDDKFRLELEEPVDGTNKTYLHMTEEGLRDHAGNRLAAADNLGSPVDRAAPVITEFIYQDRNGGNGKMAQFTVVFSEPLNAEESHLAPADLRFGRVGDFSGAEFGLNQQSVLESDGSQVVLPLSQEALVVDTFEDSRRLEIHSQGQFKLTDLAGNQNTRHGLQSQAGVTDSMKPWIKAFGYQDRDGNGLIDSWLIAFSEAVTEASRLSPNDLLIHSDLDMSFESDATDFIREQTLSVTLPLQTEISRQALEAGLEQVLFVTQNQFALSDGTRVNSDKRVQSQAAILPAADIVLGTLPPIINNDEDIELEPELELELEQSPPGFHDIRGHWAEAYIGELVDRGIVSGKTETVFAPDDPLTRAELIKMAALAFGLSLPEQVTQASFSDVQPDVWYAPYIQAARQAALIEGENGRFYPNRPVNRAEALKILIEAADFDDVYRVYFENYASKPGWHYVFFPDVKIGEWYASYVAYAKEIDLVGGYSDGNFKPQNTITRAEAAKILAKVLSLTN